MPKKAKKAKKQAKKSAKVAEKRRKADVKRAKPKKRKKSMAARKDDEYEGKKTPEPAKTDKSANDEGVEAATAAVLSDDPMSQPPDSPLSPTEAAKAEQGDKVDLSGSPGSAGEHVPVYSPEEPRPDVAPKKPAA